MYTAGVSTIQTVACKKDNSAYLYVSVWNLKCIYKHGISEILLKAAKYSISRNQSTKYVSMFIVIYVKNSKS